MGFGAMRLTGRGIWGEPTDRTLCLRVLRRAIDLGVDLIDTAYAYGPYVSEDLIREALVPFPERLVIATKAGLVRTGPNRWHPVGRPEYLRQEVEMSLRRLAVERIDLFQLHRIEFHRYRPLNSSASSPIWSGKGKSTWSASPTSRWTTWNGPARKAVPIATVQNRYNLTDRASEDVLAYCQGEGMGFIPVEPHRCGRTGPPRGELDQVTQETGATLPRWPWPGCSPAARSCCLSQGRPR